MTTDSWANIFIEECIKEDITIDREIIKQAKENTDAYESRIISLIRNRESDFIQEIDFTQCSCESELMYDSEKQEFYCPMCD